MTETSKSDQVKRVFFTIAVLYILLGFAGFAMAGFVAKAKTSLIMGGGVGAVFLMFGACVDDRRVVRYCSMSRVISALLALVFVWRATKAFKVVEKYYLGCLLVVLAVVALASAVVLNRIKVSAMKEEEGKTGKKTE